MGKMVDVRRLLPVPIYMHSPADVSLVRRPWGLEVKVKSIHCSRQQTALGQFRGRGGAHSEGMACVSERAETDHAPHSGARQPSGRARGPNA